ncbi:MAG TPA: redoxin family protein [Candidatus Binatia bacterium]|nr:redoxin family protein [Candidatus Binatia bacterium]
MERTLPLILASALVLAACSSGTSSGSGDAGATTGDAGATTGASPAGALLEHELVDVRSGDRFTLGELATDKPVLVETMAVWCTTCLAQQREVVQAHELADFHSVGIDVDPNERPDELAAYADREGFDWSFVMADAALVKLLTDAYGFAVTNPPSTPTFVVSTDGTVRALEFGKVRSAEELVAELSSG